MPDNETTPSEISSAAFNSLNAPISPTNRSPPPCDPIIGVNLNPYGPGHKRSDQPLADFPGLLASPDRRDTPTGEGHVRTSRVGRVAAQAPRRAGGRGDRD